MQGTVCVVTGAGGGIGRAHSEALARAGALVVVNDVGAGKDGTPERADTAAEVVEAITAAGGVAVANTSDVSTEAGAQALPRETDRSAAAPSATASAGRAGTA